MEKITNAAVKITIDGQDLIVSAERPFRHADIIHALWKVGIKELNNQGFLTSFGHFVDRKDGAQIAIESEQISKLEYPPVLYSEDLW